MSRVLSYQLAGEGNGHGGLLLGFGSFIRPNRSCSLSAVPGEGGRLTLSPSSCSHGSAQTHGMGLEGASHASPE